MKTKIISYWQLGNGKTFQMEGQTYAKQDRKHALKCSDNTVVELQEETQVEVVEEYQF